MGKIWKNGGEEDKFIKKLIKKGEINRFTKPSTLKKNHPRMFGEFTPNVVRNHLTALKRSNGLYLEGESDNDNNDDEEGEELFVNLEDKNTEKTSSQTSNQITSQTFDDTISGFDLINHRNYPVVCEVYKDPDTECDKVTLVLTLPGGSDDVLIEISDNGASATIKYTWPDTMYDMRELFSKMLAARTMNIHHPRVLSVKNGLEKYRKKMDAAPEACMKVYLPIKVQTASNSWSYFGIKKADGTQILMADFTGYVKDYNATVRKVRFD